MLFTSPLKVKGYAIIWCNVELSYSFVVDNYVKVNGYAIIE